MAHAHTLQWNYKPQFELLENSALRPHKAQYRNWHYSSERSRDPHMCHRKHWAQPIWDRKQTNLNIFLKLFMIFFSSSSSCYFFPCIFSYTEDLRVPRTQHIWDRKQTNCNTCLKKKLWSFFPPLFFFLLGVTSYAEDLGVQNTPKSGKWTGLRFWRERFKSNYLGETATQQTVFGRKKLQVTVNHFRDFSNLFKLKEKLTSSVKLTSSKHINSMKIQKHLQIFRVNPIFWSNKITLNLVVRRTW